MTVTALIVAAGKGERLGGGLPKQYRAIGGKPVLRHALERMIAHPRIHAVRVVIGDGQQDLAAAALGGLDVLPFVVGGRQRSDSVRNGLETAADGIVLVHDAARPFCPPSLVDRLLDAMGDADCAVPVLPVADTLGKGGAKLDAVVDRKGLLRVQTPQACRTEPLRAAFAKGDGGSATDESTLMLAAGFQVATVEGDPMLEKLTNASDWERAETMLAARLVSRTGFGFDVHAFAGNGPIMLGGFAVPHARGLAGHSDADVVLHAITDALLGAASLGDIGEHFPPSNPRWKGASSHVFLAHAASLIRERGGIIDHVDCTIIGEEPKVAPHRSAIQERVAAILSIGAGQVSIKATTTESMGFTGRREGLAAQAVATVRLEVGQ